MVCGTTACINVVRGGIYQPSDEQRACDIQKAIVMKERLSRPNRLSERVATDPDMTRKAKVVWKKMDTSNKVFPKLDEIYMSTLTCGTYMYQLKQAPGYIAEHMKPDGDFEVWLCQYSPKLLRGQISSRHRSQTKYNVWIEYDALDDSESVKDHYCTCPAGKRTLGMCAHIATIIYYMGHLNHQEKISVQPQTKKFKTTIKKSK